MPKSVADEIFQMRREVEQQLGFGGAVERGGVAPRGHQTVVQLDIGLAHMADESGIEPDQPVAAVEILEGEIVPEDEIGHVAQLSHPAPSHPGARAALICITCR